MSRRPTMFAALALTALALAACGGGSSVAGGGAAPAASTGAADDAQAMVAAHKESFCKNASSLGSLSKGTTSAMAMSPAESAKDFEALSTKVAALKADAATPELMADVELVAMRLMLEQMVMSHKADGSSVDDAMQQLDGAKSDADAAVGRLITSVKDTCGIDIS